MRNNYRGIVQFPDVAHPSCLCAVGQKLVRAGVIKDIFPLHDQQRLNDLGRRWYSKKQIWGQPLGKQQHTVNTHNIVTYCIHPHTRAGMINKMTDTDTAFLLCW
jgi:hypothetical protein